MAKSIAALLNKMGFGEKQNVLSCLSTLSAQHRARIRSFLDRVHRLERRLSSASLGRARLVPAGKPSGEDNSAPLTASIRRANAAEILTSPIGCVSAPRQ